MNREQIKDLALQHGFTLRENDDLRPYVYAFAEALVAEEQHRGDALAGAIAALCELVTIDHETKESFIARVRSVLGQDPDRRIEDLRADAKEVHAARGFLRQQDRILRELAASQAREKALRKVLEDIGDTACGEASHQYMAMTALNTPADASTLDALLQQAREEMRERGEVAAEGERLTDGTGEPDDIAYSLAIDDVVAAVRALEVKP